MMLWVFNILVVAALAYLFLNADGRNVVQDGLNWMEEREIGETRAPAVIDDPQPRAAPSPSARTETLVRAAAGPETRETERAAGPDRVATPDGGAAPDAKPNASSERKRAAEPATVAALEPITEIAPEPAPEPAPPEKTIEPGPLPLVPENALPRSADRAETVRAGLLPVDDPAVIRRRAEVLDLSDAQATPVTAAPEPPADRRQQRRVLDELAEEMELMFVEKAGR